MRGRISVYSKCQFDFSAVLYIACISSFQFFFSLTSCWCLGFACKIYTTTLKYFINDTQPEAGRELESGLYESESSSYRARRDVNMPDLS